MILENTKTGAAIPVQSISAGKRAARHLGWTDYAIFDPKEPAHG